MPHMSKKVGPTWQFVVAAPPREVFALMEQAIGAHPYRFELMGDDSARVVEIQRNGLFGQWNKKVRHPQSVRCSVKVVDEGTRAVIESDRGPAPESRALQFVRLLSQGAQDSRTPYRRRVIPPGPVSLVASWAGTSYQLFLAPRSDAARGIAVRTATQLEALPGAYGGFCRVRIPDGTEGYVEVDQVVAAPAEAVRSA